MVYGVSGDSYNDLKALRSAGIIDCHFIIHGGGSAPPTGFVADCNAAGVSPVLNNGNDGSMGWSGSDSYNANVAAMGFHAVGGESEQADEIDSIMDHLIFLDYGGEGTGGGTNDCVWCSTHSAPVHGFGAASYMETYDSATNLWGWDVMSQGMLSAKAHGVKEIGLCVGTWMINHSSAQDYINIANQMEANGVTCAGIVIWGGYGSDMNGVYNEFASWFQQWQAIWPPETRTMKQRYGSAPPPPPVNTVTPADFSYGLHAVDPVKKTITFTGSMYDASKKLVANAQINLDRSAKRGIKDSSWKPVGSAVSNANGNYTFTAPLASGANYFWLVSKDGKRGYWTNDVVYV